MRSFILLLLLTTCYGKASFARKINFCSISINSTDEINEFKRQLSGSDFNFIELTNSNDDYHSDWTEGACSRLSESNITCDILLISGHFAGEVFFGVRGNADKRVFTKHLLRKMCDGSCDNLLKGPKLVMLFGGNTLHEQEGATAQEKRKYLRRLTKSIGPGAAQRLVEAKFGPYGKAYNEQMRRLFNPTADILGFEEAGLSGPRAARRIRSFLRRIRDFKAQFQQNYSDPSIGAISGQTVQMSSNIITQSFVSTFGSVSGTVCPGIESSQSPRQISEDHQINANICRITDPTERYDDRIRLAKQLLESDKADTYIPWIENLFREHPPSFQRDGTPFYENYQENRAFDQFMSALPSMPQSFRDLMDNTDNGFTKIQQLSTARYLNWITPEQYTQQVKTILQSEFRTLRRSGLDQDTIDLLCHLQPVVQPLIERENLLSPYARKWRRSISRLNTCFQSEIRRRQY